MYGIWLALSPSAFAAEPLENTGEITYHKEGAHTFPDFAFTDINPQSQSYKETVSLDSLLEHHKPVVVNFWSYGCTPCLAEMLDLERVHRSGNAVVVGLSYAGSQVYSPEVRDMNISQSVFKNAEKILVSITYPLLGSATEDPRMKTLFESLPYHETIITPNGPFLVYGVPLTIILRPGGTIDGFYRGADHTIYEKLSAVLHLLK